MASSEVDKEDGASAPLQRAEDGSAETDPSVAQGEVLPDGRSGSLPDSLVRYAVATGNASATYVHLDMARRNVKLATLIALSEYLTLLDAPLVSLTLSRNVLGPKGASLLGKALVTNNTLESLELEQCELVGSAYRPQYDGIKALAKGFESGRSTLRRVNLAGNGLLPEGCRIVLGSLSFHPTLAVLDMSNNLLSVFNDREGYLALSYVIRFAKQLRSLAIDDNPLPPHAWTILQVSLEVNTTLTSLSVARCGIPIDRLRPSTA